MRAVSTRLTLTLFLAWAASGCDVFLPDKGNLGQPCLDDGSCRQGICIAEECTQAQACTNSGECDDGDICNGTETCDGQVCLPGLALDCDDADLCTDDECDLTDGCRHTFNTAPCDDGKDCSGDDTCNNGVCEGYPADQDGDGILSVDCFGADCDDSDGDIYPGAEEICDNGIDDDCDTDTDDFDSDCQTCATDLDCPAGLECTDPWCNPQTERCGFTVKADRCLIAGTCYQPGDPSDENPCSVCDPGQAPEDWSPAPNDTVCAAGDICVMFICQAGICSGAHRDEDLDGHVSAACGGSDCDDGDPGIHPGADEIQGDGIDQDCSGTDLGLGCADEDTDGFYDHTCGGTDCLDQDGNVKPGALEICDDGVDNDCNGLVDGADFQCCQDVDSDGFFDAACGGTDCDDTLATGPAINPNAREDAGQGTCDDGADNDCDGYLDTQDPGCAPAICSPDGWCWEHPWPQGHHLYDVWVSSRGDIWAVGEGGTILRGRRGGTDHWWLEASGTQNDLYAIWGMAPNDVWAVGAEGIILHFDGRQWSTDRAADALQPDLTDVFGFDAHNIWVVGSEATVLQRSDFGWFQHPMNLPVGYGAFEAIWGPDPTELWVVGGPADANLVHYRAGTWQPAAVPGCGHLRDVWGASRTEVLAVGGADNRAQACNWDGEQWLMASGLPQDEGYQLNSLQGLTFGNAIAVGGSLGTDSKDLVVTWDGFGFAGGEPLGGPALFGLHVEISGRATGVGLGGAILDINGGDSWLSEVRTIADLNAIHGHPSAIGQFWIVGQAGTILRWDGSNMFNEEVSGAAGLQDLLGVCELPSREAWAVGNQGAVFRYFGESWNDYSADHGMQDNDFHAVWGISNQAVYTLGTQGAGLRWSAGISSNISPNLAGYDWFGLFGWDTGTPREESGWAVGADGFVVELSPQGPGDSTFHDKVQAWNGLDASLRGVWGPSVDELWVVGDDQSLLHAVFPDWTSFDPLLPDPIDFTAIFGVGSNPGQAWIVGTQGTILRLGQNYEWVEQASGTLRDLRGVWQEPDSPHRVWVVGQDGSVLRKEEP